MTETTATHEISTLDSGVRVVTERIPSVRSVALGFWIATGSVLERDTEAGLSHLLEHMLFRGTARYGSEEIDQIFDSMGAELNAGTGKEMTSVHARVLDRHLEKAFDVIGDMVWRPKIEELEAEREVVLEEIAMYEDDPQDRVFDLLGEAVFGAHPLGRAILGRADVVGAAEQDQLAAFHAARYTPGNVVIAAAGSVDHEQVVAWAREACPTGPGPTRRESAGATGGERPDVALPRQGHRAVPRLPRRAGARPGRRPPLRAAGARHAARRDQLVAPLPGGPREAGPGVLGVQLPHAVRRGRPGRHLRRDAGGEPRGDAPRDRRRARADLGRPGRGRPSSSGRGTTSRDVSCSRSSRRRREWTGSARASWPTCRSSTSTR